jgi:glycerophosphoryl diester phosphodiesterase
VASTHEDGRSGGEGMAALTKAVVPEIYTVGMAERSTVQSFDWSALNLTRRIAEAHELGLPVLTWTVHTEADMERQLDLGVDGITIDYPTRLRALMEERGMRLPKSYELKG